VLTAMNLQAQCVHIRIQLFGRIRAGLRVLDARCGGRRHPRVAARRDLVLFRF
jgi:hypothetical protein